MMKALCTFLTVAFILALASSVSAQTWALATGGSWNATASWDPQTVPNATGAAVTVNVAGNGGTVADQTVNRVLALDASQTVGSIAINFNSATANTLRNDIGIG